MSIATTAEQQAVQESIAAWARSAAPLETVRGCESEPARWRERFEAMADLGVLSVALPEEADGAGGTVADLAAMLEAAAGALAPGPVLTSALAGLVLARGGGVDAGLAPALAAGERTCGVAVGPGAVDAARGGDGAVLLTGGAGLVYGFDADGLILLRAGAGRDSAESAETWVVIDASADGVLAEPQTATDFSVPLASVRLEDVAVPADRVLTNLRPGLVTDLFAALASAEAAGVAGWALDTAVEYATIREQFGRRIGSFQAVKHICAEMLVRAEQARAVAWDAAVAADETGSDETGSDGAELPIAASVAAAAALDCAVDNVKDCIQVLGGIGFTWEHDAHLYFRRALSLRQVLGGSDAWRRRTAQLTLDGTRRHLRLQLDEATEAHRGDVRGQVERIARTSGTERRDALATTGLLTPHWPRPYGRGAGAGEQVLIDEELERAGIERPDLVIGGWAAPTIIEHGTEEQVARFVPATLRGEISWCQLFSEPGAGSDLASLRTSAERVDGGWKLAGQKVWTSLAVESDWAICLARTDKEARKHKGITYFLVDMRSAGIRISPLREITGDALFNEVYLEDVFVPDACVVGEVNGGWRLARTTLANERVAMGGSSAMGEEMEGLIGEVREYSADPTSPASGRPDASGPIGAAFTGGQLTDTQLATLGAQVGEGTTGSLLGLRSAIRALEGKGPGPESSVRKLIGVRHRQAIADASLELAGVGGAAWGPQAKAVLHHRCLTIAGGTTQILLTVAAEHILGLPRG